LFRTPPGLQGPGPQRRSVGNAVQSVADQLAGLERAGLAHQHQEGGLKRVFDVVLMAQDAPADAEHHGAVASDQLLEGRLFALGEEPLQQLAIGELDVRMEVARPAQVAEKYVHGGHSQSGKALYIYSSKE